MFTIEKKIFLTGSWWEYDFHFFFQLSKAVAWLLGCFTILTTSPCLGNFSPVKFLDYLSKGEAEESFPAGAWHATSSTHHCGASGAQVISGNSTWEHFIVSPVESEPVPYSYNKYWLHTYSLPRHCLGSLEHVREPKILALIEVKHSSRGDG